MITCRTATLSELETVLDWAAAEGWNPGLDDAAAFHATDLAGFFVATENDVPIAGICVVNHSDTFAFLGLYIVLPAHRGRGIGVQLWEHALRHAGGRTVGLDGVAEQQANYEKSGFAPAGGTTRYSGLVSGVMSPDVRAVRPEEMPNLIDAEAKASGTDKPTYLSAWFAASPTRKTLVLDKHGSALGFCTVRQCREGSKIGPLVAHEANVAEVLIRHAATLFDGLVSIDVPDVSTDLADLCQRMSLKPGFKTARMYRGEFDGKNAGGLFAVTSLELG